MAGRSSWYEQRKLAVVAATLRRQHYAAAWDPACGTGHLARHLASVADQVLATDGAPGAIEISRKTCGGLSNVELEICVLPATPGGSRSLRSGGAERVRLLPPAGRTPSYTGEVRRLSAPQAEIVSVHWRHRPHDAYASGEETQTEIVDELSARGWRHPVRHLEEDFVLDVMERADRAERI